MKRMSLAGLVDPPGSKVLLEFQLLSHLSNGSRIRFGMAKRILSAP